MDSGFPVPKILTKFHWDLPQRGRQIQVRWLKSRIFNKYLALTHKRCKIETYCSYSGRLIEGRLHSIEWCCFSDLDWSLTVSNELIFYTLRLLSYVHNGCVWRLQVVDRYRLFAPQPQFAPWTFRPTLDISPHRWFAHRRFTPWCGAKRP